MKASICMATFNREPRVLRLVLESICRQTEQFPMEVVVVDDGSRLSAKEVCSEFNVTYARIEREPIPRNPSVARNVAYRMASGEIIIAQSDDVEHQQRNSIELLCQEIEGNPHSFVIATVVGCDERGEPAKVFTGRWNGQSRHMPLFFLGAVWTRDVYSIGGNDEEFAKSPGNGGHEDKWFAACLTKGLGRTPFYTDKVVGYHHWHPRSSNNKQLRTNGRLYKEKAAAASTTGVWCAGGGSWRE